MDKISKEDIAVLKELCAIHATSGNEKPMKDFLLGYIDANKKYYKVQPKIIHGDDFQDCFLMVFGEPKTAVFAHMDSIGFTTRYDNQLVAIGGPEVKSGVSLSGSDALGPIACNLQVDEEHHLFHDFGRGIVPGTDLVFSPNFRETEAFIQSPYLDNRMGIFNVLKLAETLTDGIIVFSCYEEHGGGTVPFLAKYIYEQYKIKQALISDITWVTEGVRHDEGVVISIRDRNIPRKFFLDKIITAAAMSGVKHQFEVEAYGSSDGRELQESPYPIDWCFIGAPEDNVHSPDEIVHKNDLVAMINMYRFLMHQL